MSITDNKILSADLVGKKVIDRPDDMDTDADVTKAWFDAYPDVITGKHNDLITALDNIAGRIIVPSTIAAATSNKGSYEGTVPIGGFVWVLFQAGNTASSPTITIGGDALSFANIPTVAKLSGSSYQCYMCLRSASTLTFVTQPDYVTEWGDSGVWEYERKASGQCRCYMNDDSVASIDNMDEVDGSGIWMTHTALSLSLPTGLFSAVNYTANLTPASETYVLGINPKYSTSTANTLKYNILKGGNSTTGVSFRGTVGGRWK